MNRQTAAHIAAALLLMSDLNKTLWAMATINISYERYRRAINNANDMVLMCYAYSLTSPCHCYCDSHYYRLFNVLFISYLCSIYDLPMCYRYATSMLSICYNAIDVPLRCYQCTFTMLLICDLYAMTAILFHQDAISMPYLCSFRQWFAINKFSFLVLLGNAISIFISADVTISLSASVSLPAYYGITPSYPL